jgi:hypothetical protein
VIRQFIRIMMTALSRRFAERAEVAQSRAQCPHRMPSSTIVLTSTAAAAAPRSAEDLPAERERSSRVNYRILPPADASSDARYPPHHVAASRPQNFLASAITDS